MRFAPRPTPRIRYSDLDAFGEWENARSYPEEVALLESNLGSYHDSCSRIRAKRPDTSREGQVFWDDPLNRAHLMNALLRRENRPITRVEADLGLPEGKFYVYKEKWGLRFTPRPSKQVTVRDPRGNLYEADIEEHLPGTRALLRVQGYPDLVRGVWSPANRAYNLYEPLDEPVGTLGTTRAAAVAGLHPVTLAQALASLGVRSNGKVYLCYLARLVDPARWLDGAYAAMIDELDEPPPPGPAPGAVPVRLADVFDPAAPAADAHLWAQHLADALDVYLAHPTSRHTLPNALARLELPERVGTLLAVGAGPRTWLTEPVFADDPTGPQQRTRTPTLAPHPAAWDDEGLVGETGLSPKGRAVLQAFWDLAHAYNVNL